jgi:hypothetical protein
VDNDGQEVAEENMNRPIGQFRDSSRAKSKRISRIPYHLLSQHFISDVVLPDICYKSFTEEHKRSSVVIKVIKKKSVSGESSIRRESGDEMLESPEGVNVEEVIELLTAFEDLYKLMKWNEKEREYDKQNEIVGENEEDVKKEQLSKKTEEDRKNVEANVSYYLVLFRTRRLALLCVSVLAPDLLDVHLLVKDP